MKPLVSTTRIKEGSLDEQNVLKALPKFLANTSLVLKSMRDLVHTDEDIIDLVAPGYTKNTGSDCS